MSSLKERGGNRQMFDESKLYVNDADTEGMDFENLNFDQKSPETMPPPCPGYTLSSGVDTANAKRLRDDVMKEIREFAKQIKDSLSKILEDIELLKKSMGSLIEYEDASCQTESLKDTNGMHTSTECTGEFLSSPEPHYLNDENVKITEESVKKDPWEASHDPYFQDKEHFGKENKPVAQPRKKITDPFAETTSSRRQRIHFNSETCNDKVVFVAPRQKLHAKQRVSTTNERECLANALQFHIEDLVNGFDLRSSEVLDSLLAERCITRDEYSSLQKVSDRKDRIRILLSLLKSRDIRVLMDFMKHVERHSLHVAEKINRTFDNYKHTSVERKLCVLCTFKRHINIKDVADCMWAVQVIDDGLYNRIVHSNAQTGAQGSLWKKFFDSLNELNYQNAELAHSKLLNTLSSGNMFTHLVKDTREMLAQNNGKFICNCEVPGMISDIPKESKTKSLNSTFKSTSEETGNDTAQGSSTPEVKPRHLKSSVSSSSKLKILQKSETGVGLKHDTPPTLSRKPTWSDESKGDELLLLSKNQMATDDLAAIKSSNIDSLVDEIPPLPVKKNRIPEWNKIQDTHSNLV